MESRIRQYDLSRYRLAFRLLAPPCRSRLLRRPFPLRGRHWSLAGVSRRLTASTPHSSHVGRQVGWNLGRWFWSGSLFRRLLYNPLGDLVGVVGPFSFADRHASIFSQEKMLKRLAEIQSDPVPIAQTAHASIYDGDGKQTK